MSKRKYITEFGLNAFCTQTQLFSPSKLKILDKYLENIEEYKIYFICSRPRIFFDVPSIRIEKNLMRGNIIVLKDAKNVYYSFITKLPPGKVDFYSDNPFTEYKLLVNGVEYSSGMSALQSSKLQPQIKEDIPMKILYIGQSLPQNGRTIRDRLLNHSTLQEICVNILSKSPNEEVWLVLAKFEKILLATIDGKSETEASLEENESHVQSFLNNMTIESAQELNLIEAGLIRYFKPEYNKLLKIDNPKHKYASYKDYFDIELNSLVVEMQTESLGIKFCTDTIKPSWFHIGKFSLYTKEERKEMFDLFTELKS